MGVKPEFAWRAFRFDRDWYLYDQNVRFAQISFEGHEGGGHKPGTIKLMFREFDSDPTQLGFKPHDWWKHTENVNCPKKYQTLWEAMELGVRYARGELGMFWDGKYPRHKKYYIPEEMLPRYKFAWMRDGTDNSWHLVDYMGTKYVRMDRNRDGDNRVYYDLIYREETHDPTRFEMDDEWRKPGAGVTREENFTSLPEAMETAIKYAKGELGVIYRVGEKRTTFFGQRPSPLQPIVKPEDK